MFTAIEFKLIREKCPEKLDALLANLKIENPNWNSGDEFRIYEKLLALGDLKFDYSKTDNEILNEVLHFEKQIKNRLQEKLVEYEKISVALPEVEPAGFDYSKVKIEISEKRKAMSLVAWKDKNKLQFSEELKTQIKNLICDYVRREKNYNVVESIKVSVKTEDGIYSEKTRPKIPARPEKPPFTQKEFSEAVESLRLVEDIIKSI